MLRGASRAGVLTIALAALGGCRQAGPGGAPSLPAAVAKGKALFEQGQLDAALAKLQEAPADPDSLYYQGAIWARKAESASLATPPPSPVPRGAETPPPPEFKPEELRALELFEKAVAARPDHARAHLGIAELLAPHALRRHEREEAARKQPARRRTPETPDPAVPDLSVERVVQAYRTAMNSGAGSKEAAESLIRFALSVGRLDAADEAFRGMVERDKHNPEPLVRYGDFLARDKKDLEAAIPQYKMALIWRPDDEATQARVADAYIAMGTEHFGKREYALAEARFAEAEKHVTSPGSIQGQQVQEYLGKLKALRTR